MCVALIDLNEGVPLLGVIGSPRLDDKSGRLFAAARGLGAYQFSLFDNDDSDGEKLVTNAASRRRLESVESAHSAFDVAQLIAKNASIDDELVRMDSQTKYGALSRGDAALYLRLPTRPDYKECVWDHAAGVVLLEEAGGCVSDVFGRPLDFAGVGRTLANNTGVVASASSAVHKRVIKALDDEREQLVEPKEPREPMQSECCGNGCYPCIWEIYDTAITDFNKQHALFRQKQLALTGVASADRSMAPSDKAPPKAALDAFAKFEMQMAAKQKAKKA